MVCRQTSFIRCERYFTVGISEYIEDLCPYATFQLNKQTYSESSYSGNVYSGPYHSVRGSFVYHENKNDSYRVRLNVLSFFWRLKSEIIIFYISVSNDMVQLPSKS